MAAGFQALGIGPGEHVALLGPTSRPLVTAIQATWLAGAATVVLPLPMRLGSIEEFVAQTRARVRNADAALVVVDPDLAAFLEPEAGDPPMVLLSDLTPGPGRPKAAHFAPPLQDPGALAILQFTSGSTADPKGVMLPHRQVLANLDAITAAARIDRETDVAVSWLPLYHDMGLIGLLLTPLINGMELVLGGPQDFMSAPARWMEWMAAYGGTITAGPNFAYALAARALNRLDGLQLSRWRLGLNGAEPVDPAAVEGFLTAGARHGVDPRSAFCAFGMAEATLAVTFPEAGIGMTTDTVDRRVLETDRYAAPVTAASVTAAPGMATTDGSATRRFARLGRPLAGLEVRVCDPDSGLVMRDREVGELEIRGSSVTPGYYRRPEETALAFHDGWLRTGDLAYLVDDELVVCGRIKDVIIVGGRNVFPEDVERAVESVNGVRPGNVVAFGIEGSRGREELVVVAETRLPAGDAVGHAGRAGPAGGSGHPDGGGQADLPAVDRRSVRDAVARRVRQTVGVPPRDVLLVKPGSLPKTSSGKLQRSLCRTRYLSSELPGI